VDGVLEATTTTGGGIIQGCPCWSDLAREGVGVVSRRISQYRKNKLILLRVALRSNSRLKRRPFSGFGCNRKKRRNYFSHSGLDPTTAICGSEGKTKKIFGKRGAERGHGDCLGGRSTEKARGVNIEKRYRTSPETLPRTEKKGNEGLVAKRKVFTFQVTFVTRGIKSREGRRLSGKSRINLVGTSHGYSMATAYPKTALVKLKIFYLFLTNTRRGVQNRVSRSKEDESAEFGGGLARQGWLAASKIMVGVSRTSLEEGVKCGGGGGYTEYLTSKLLWFQMRRLDDKEVCDITHHRKSCSRREYKHQSSLS